MPYSYSPLLPEHREIRVVSLLPGSFQDPVHCELEVVSLDESPSYEALSYVWADPPGTSSITLNGSSYEVTFNLASALRRLRTKDGIRTIWIDALCIDQENKTEKSYQVALMGEIYRHTTHVFLYLGDSISSGVADSLTIAERNNLPWDGKSYDGRYTMEYAGPYFILGDSDTVFGITEAPTIDEENDLPWGREEGKLRDPGFAAMWLVYMFSCGRHLHELPCFSGHATKVLFSSKRFEAAFQALSDLLALAWWRRIWVVQETILPPQVTVVLGSCHAPWAMFAAAVKTLERHDATCCSIAFRNSPSCLTMIFERFMYNVLELDSERDKYHERGSTRAFFDLMWQYRCREASDPRDMIYGLLGIATDMGTGDGIKPDYNLVKQEVYQRTTIFIIEQLKSLYVLLGSRSEDSDMPSWIPDWGVPIETRQWLHERTRLRNLEYNTSKGHEVKMRVGANALLLLKGVFVDTVVSGGKLVSAYATHKDLTLTINDWQAQAGLPKNDGQPYVGSGNRRDAFWRTITRDMTVDFSGEQRRNEHWDYVPIAQWWNTNVTGISTENVQQLKLSWFKAAVQSIAGWWSNGGRNQEEFVSEPMIAIFMRMVGGGTAGHTFFMTKKGYFGLGNPKIGDQVFVLFGGVVPFLLRPDLQTSHYRLVGDCYLHGIMDGEAMDGWVEKEMTVVLM